MTLVGFVRVLKCGRCDVIWMPVAGLMCWCCGWFATEWF